MFESAAREYKGYIGRFAPGFNKNFRDLVDLSKYSGKMDPDLGGGYSDGNDSKKGIHADIRLPGPPIGEIGQAWPQIFFPMGLKGDNGR